MADFKKAAPYLAPLVERCRLDATAVRGAKAPYWTDDALTPERLLRHLTGGTPRGVCPIKAGESTTRVGLLDLDSHRGEIEWGDMVAIAIRLIEAAQRRGIFFTAFRSGGGSGIHLYAIWDAAQDAHSVRVALRQVLADCNLSDGTGGVKRNQAEVFPRQDSVPIDGYGNQFFLPLAGKSKALDPMGLEDMPAQDITWTSSRDVPFVVKPERQLVNVTDRPDLARVREALDAIPNDGEGLDYEPWRNLLFAVHHATGGSNEGLELFHEFSARSAKYDEIDTDRWWNHADANREGGITSETLFHVAREAVLPAQVEADFQELAADVIEVDVVQVAAAPAAAPSVQVFPSLTFLRDTNGLIKVTQRNLLTAIGSPEWLGLHVAHDTFRDEILVAPVDRPGEWRPLAETDYTLIQARLDDGRFKTTPGKDMVRDAVRAIGSRNQFDSAIKWLREVVPTWDGVKRIEQFYSQYLNTEDSEYARSLGLYTWTALAARCLDPGHKADMMPIWVSKQGTKKSSSIAAMVVDRAHFAEISLHMEDDDLARRMRGKLVCEIAELHGMKTREIESIKAFLTRTEDVWVPKYVELARSYQRRCIFIGTANGNQFLADPTGNRRFLPTWVGEIDIDAIERDRLQLWAEARELFDRSGLAFSWAERLAENEHDKFKARDPWHDDIATYVHSIDPHNEWGYSRAEVGVSTTQVLRECLCIETARMDRGKEMRVADVLRELGMTSIRVMQGAAKTRVWKLQS
jgi:predicted P-loop ATPase